MRMFGENGRWPLSVLLVVVGDTAVCSTATHCFARLGSEWIGRKTVAKCMLHLSDLPQRQAWWVLGRARGPRDSRASCLPYESFARASSATQNKSTTNGSEVRLAAGQHEDRKRDSLLSHRTKVLEPRLVQNPQTTHAAAMAGHTDGGVYTHDAEELYPDPSAVRREDSVVEIVRSVQFVSSDFFNHLIHFFKMTISASSSSGFPLWHRDNIRAFYVQFWIFRPIKSGFLQLSYY